MRQQLRQLGDADSIAGGVVGVPTPDMAHEETAAAVAVEDGSQSLNRVFQASPYL